MRPDFKPTTPEGVNEGTQFSVNSNFLANYQLTTIFLAKYQLTVNLFAPFADRRPTKWGKRTVVLVSIRFVFEPVKSNGCEMRETVHKLLNWGKRKPREWVSKIGCEEFYGKKLSHSHVNEERRCTGTRSCGIYTAVSNETWWCEWLGR